MRKEFSSDEFLRLKALAIKNEPTTIATTLSNIIIEADSFDKKYIIVILPQVGKHQLTVSGSFFKELAKILKINLTLRARLTDDEGSNRTFSEFLNALKVVQQNVTPIPVTLLFDKVQREITHIKQGEYSRLSNAELFNFAEGLVNKYPTLSVEHVQGGEFTGDALIKILSGDVVSLTNKRLSNEDESFKFGLTIGNQGLTTSAGDFAMRLICTNGMKGIRTDERFFLKDTTEKGLRELFEHFEKMKETAFIPEDFATNFEKATQVHASYAELMSAYKFATSRLLLEFPEQADQIRSAFSDTFFPDIRAIETKLKLGNIDSGELTDKAMKYIRTKTTMWELINTMTDLGSNDHPVYKIRNKEQFQNYGGKMMQGDFDFEWERFLLL